MECFGGVGVLEALEHACALLASETCLLSMHQSRYVKEGSHVRCILFLGGIARSVDQRPMSYDKSG